MEVYGNSLPRARVEGAKRSAARLARRFGYDPAWNAGIRLGEPKADPPLLGILPLEPGETQLSDPSSAQWTAPAPGLVLGTIRMGFGHYRMALAIASASHARGLVPYWLDFLRFKDSAAAGIMHYLESLYRFGSRLSQKIPLFNHLVWEKITDQVARPISNTVRDIALAEVFAQIPRSLDPSLPYVATHPWTARAAVAAGMTRVVSIIPDNMPLAFNVSPGAVHAVQTPSAFLGYRTLRNMGDHVFSGPDGFRTLQNLKPMSEGSIFYSGHYVDHELVANLEADCSRRTERMHQGSPRRLLLTIGGAGAQLSKFLRILRHLGPDIQHGRAAVIVNMGDHYDRLGELTKGLESLGIVPRILDDVWTDFQTFVDDLRSADLVGVTIVLHRDTFPAVYSTNLLMRECDVLVTKPSELSFYPIPKLFIQRVGRHEAWGAIHSAEIGDGSMETSRMAQVLQLLDIFIHGRDLLPLYVDRILANERAGVYDGAYRVVDQVMGL